MSDLNDWVEDQEGAGQSLEEALTPEQPQRLSSLGYLQ